MSIASMTGFARRSDSFGDNRWDWELRSVNSRGLEVRCRLAPGAESIERSLREAIARRFKRGNFNANLTLFRASEQEGVRINQRAFERQMHALRRYQLRFGRQPISLATLLTARGVLEPAGAVETEDAREALAKHLLMSFETLIGDLERARHMEGERMAAVVRDHLEAMTRLTCEATDDAERRPKRHLERLREQLQSLMADAGALPEDRLLQEIAILASKTDVQEELDRLKAHCEAATALLDGGGAIGRKLDFLTQELNREANTLCAKANDIDLTRTGLALKGVIDQLREQAQNIE